MIFQSVSNQLLTIATTTTTSDDNMPLPPALLERLKRRKIVHERDESLPTKNQPSSVETSSSCPASASRVTIESRYQGSTESCSDSIVHGYNSGREVEEPEEEIIAEDYSDEDSDARASDQDEPASIRVEGDSSRLTDDGSGSDSGDEEEEDECREIRQEKCNKSVGSLHEEEKTTQARGSLVEGEQKQQRKVEVGKCDDKGEPRNTDSNIVDRKNHESVIGCPNKYNIYHMCGQYCRDKYAQPKEEHMVPTVEQRKQLALLLKTFPMSNEWSVVYDPGVRTFYFWNIITGHVSWVPPGMSAFASPSANQIREAYMEAEQQRRTSHVLSLDR